MLRGAHRGVGFPVLSGGQVSPEADPGTPGVLSGMGGICPYYSAPLPRVEFSRRKGTNAKESNLDVRREKCVKCKVSA